MDDADLTQRLRVWALDHSEKLPDPATPEQVDAAEARLGFALHPLLRRVYTEVADGGFGPDDFELVPIAELERGGPGRTVMVMDVGCGMTSEVDCDDPGGRVLLMDPNAFAREDPDAWSFDAATLEQWLELWLDGTSWLLGDDRADTTEEADWPEPWEGAAEWLRSQQAESEPS